MSYTEIYVDPSIAGDSGTGIIGDPYGDLEYALENATQGVGATRVNIKVGTDEVLAAELGDAIDTGTWTIAAATPLIFEGYSAAAGDLRGTTTRAGISGGGSVPILNDVAKNYITFAHLHLHNVGANNIVNGNDNISILFCEIENTTANGISLDEAAIVVGNYIHNIGNGGIIGTLGDSFIAYNRFANGTNNFDPAAVENCAGTIFRNIIVLDGASDGIQVNNNNYVVGNSVYSNGGTGTGIETRASIAGLITNNLVEGFSGTGGIGVAYGAGPNACVRAFGGNSVYNCETDFVAPDVQEHYTPPAGTSADESLTSSPFTDAANGDFSPVATGNVKESPWPASIPDS